MTSKVERDCKQCGDGFEARKDKIQKGYGKFCSLSCSSKFNADKRSEDKENNVECALCGERFRKIPSEVNNTKSGLHFCCREHKDEAQKLGNGFKSIQPHHYGTAGNGKDRNGNPTSFSKYRKRAFRAFDGECAECGWDTYKGVLKVHHIDRDRTNNSLENLKILCPTCHNVDHFKAGDGPFGSNQEN